MRFLIVAVILFATGGAYAQALTDCDWRSDARNLVEPWTENTRTFANGDVRLALIDTWEPAAAAFHILILSPPYDELGLRQCRLLSWDADGAGFGGLEFQALNASYDPGVGLMFDMPVMLHVPDSDRFAPGLLSFSINQATGAFSAAVALP